MSMALDKNWIDTTSFDVLQPAIDYFLVHGSSNEALRTYYYQGRIYQNRGDRDNAVNSFIKASHIAPDCSDSLCIARTLVALGILYKDFYDFGSYMDCYLQSANIYRDLSYNNKMFDCYLNALNGAIILKNQVMCDSILDILGDFEFTYKSLTNSLYPYRLSYNLNFGSDKKLKELVDSSQYMAEFDTNCLLSLVQAYNRLGNNTKAKELLSLVNHCGLEYDTLKYLATLFSVQENLEEYKEALITYQDFSNRLDSINAYKFTQKAQSLNEKYEMEANATRIKSRSIRIIMGCIGGIALLIMGIFILLLLVRSNHIKKELAIEKVKTKEIENARLKYEREKLALETSQLALENKNLQLERDNAALEAENLTHRLEMLENESDSLKGLIDVQEELPKEVQDAIQVRIEMLNSLIASYITSNESYGKSYDSWIKTLTEDTYEFMNSNRLAFQASHPRFIHYFEERGLTIDEINYVCLYAIGLRGKEVGNYMKKRSHVNTSSAIRRKLGIDKHETNIGIYVRKLLKQL